MGENIVKVWRMPDLHDAELLKARYARHSYPWHSHEEISLGLVLQGAVALRTRSREGIAKPGSFVIINTGEIHQGCSAAAEGWYCRTIHILPHVIRATTEELKLFGRIPDISFQSPTINDPGFANVLFRLHRCSESAGSPLGRQSQMVTLIGHLLTRHAGFPLAGPEVAPREPLVVKKARDYLDENLSDKITLDEIASVAGSTPFRLLRAFRQSLGLTPHAYHTQAKVRRAHSMLRQRSPLADVAAATGFADQAHLTRVYKGMMGATPGQFRKAALSKLRR
jgi:AraC-like DNA-binding protein